MRNMDHEMKYESALILSAFENRLRAVLVEHIMQTNAAAERNTNIKLAESPWNQSGRRGEDLWRKDLLK